MRTEVNNEIATVFSGLSTKSKLYRCRRIFLCFFCHQKVQGLIQKFAKGGADPFPSSPFPFSLPLKNRPP